MNIGLIANGEAGSSCRTKLNSVITAVNETVSDVFTWHYTGVLPLGFPPIIQVDCTGGQADILGVSGSIPVTPFDGVCTQTPITFTDPVGGLTSLTFDNLAGIMGSANFLPQSVSAITSISLPKLAYVGGNFGPLTMASLTTLSIPVLAYAGQFVPTGMNSLTTLSAPELVYAGGFSPNTMSALTTFNFPLLRSVPGTFSPNTMGSLTTVSMPSLVYIASNASLATMASLTTANFPAMIQWGGTITMNTALGNLANVTLGTVGTLKVITGATTNISGQKLTAASVNALLALLVSLDGTNGTTLWGAGKTVNVSGGTSSAPTGQGIVNKATLIARGATVTTN